MDQEKNQFNKETVGRKSFVYRYKRMVWGLLGLFLLIGVAIYLYQQDIKQETAEDSAEGEDAIEVTVKSFDELVGEATIEKIATLEPVVGAPLVARAGGRVTSVEINLGEKVTAGKVVASIDAGIEANPARAQLLAGKSSLEQINSIEKEALRAGENGVKMAQLAVDAAKSGKNLTSIQLAKAREQAALAVRQAELSYSDAVEAEQRVDQVVRAADIGLQAARLAQDQAVIAQRLATQQVSDGIKQAEQGLVAAKQALDKIKVDIQAQRISLQGQVSVLAEQVKLAQIISPVSGQVTRLTIKEGDFVRPGQEVGEVIAFEGAEIKLNVATGVRDKLQIGDQLNIRTKGQSFSGQVTRMADGPSTDMALWQVDIFVAGTPEVVHPGDLVVVELPIKAERTESAFIPLDVVVVREQGIVLMIVGDDGLVDERVVIPISYTGNFIEGVVAVNGEERVIVQGQRMLRDGDMVEIKS